MKPKGMSHPPLSGLALVGTWLSAIVVSWAVLCFVGLMLVIIWHEIGTANLLWGAGAVAACAWAWREFRINWTDANARYWT